MQEFKKLFNPIIKILADETFIGVFAVLIVRFIVLNVPELAPNEGNFVNVLSYVLLGVLGLREFSLSILGRFLADNYDFAYETTQTIKALRQHGVEITTEQEALAVGFMKIADEVLETPKVS